jgi:hypothetical protein
MSAVGGAGGGGAERETVDAARMETCSRSTLFFLSSVADEFRPP